MKSMLLSLMFMVDVLFKFIVDEKCVDIIHSLLSTYLFIDKIQSYYSSYYSSTYSQIMVDEKCVDVI